MRVIFCLCSPGVENDQPGRACGFGQALALAFSLPIYDSQVGKVAGGGIV